jgi:hypothetical protein
MTLANMGQNGVRMIWTKCPVVRDAQFNTWHTLSP